MTGLAFHNFVSAAAGAAVAVAFIRGLVRRRTRTLGNFWVDLIRTCVRVLVPLAFVAAIVFMSQGVIDNFHASRTVTTVAGQTQTIPGGPVASQEAIKEGGQNGGGFFGANSTHPFENPNGITNLLRDVADPGHSLRPDLHVRQDGPRPEAGVGGVRHHVCPLAGDAAHRYARWRPGAIRS